MKKNKQMKVKHRNPLVTLAMFRKAGYHGKTEKASRNLANVNLKKEKYE